MGPVANTVAPTHTTVVNSAVIDAPAELVYAWCVDVEAWPRVFASVESVEQRVTGKDRVTFGMTVANDLGRNTVESHRSYDRDGLRIDFTMTTLPPAISAMDGTWTVTAAEGGARLEIVHNAVPHHTVDPDKIAATLHANTERVLAELTAWVEADRDHAALYAAMRASTSKITPEMFTVCELFFSRLGLCGLDWGDIFMVCKDLRKKSTHEDWDDWHARWFALGRHYERRAGASFSAGRVETGRMCLARAAACLHFAEFFYFDEPATKIATRDEVTAVFERARPYLPTPVRPLAIPFKGRELPGYLMTPNGSGPWPTVVLVNGLDSAKEVELQAFGSAFTARGMAAVVFDGPGQGVLTGREPMEIEYENVVAAVFETLAGVSEVDMDRVGMFGVSFGGYLAPRAAACHQDVVKAVISLSGGFDHDTYEDMNIMVRKDFRFVFDVDTDEEMAELSRERLNLRSVPRLRVPLLAIHPEEDKIIPFDACLRMLEWAEGDTELMRYAGARHVAPEHFADYIPYFADWMAEHLGAR